MADKGLMATISGMLSGGSVKDAELDALYDDLASREPVTAQEMLRITGGWTTPMVVKMIVCKLGGVEGTQQATPYERWFIAQCGCPVEDQFNDPSPAFVAAVEKARRLLVEHRPRNREQLEALVA